MVIAFLANRYAPTSRGLRSGSSYSSHDSSVRSRNSNRFGLTAGHERKSFRAIAFLTSLASDFDLVSDWLFLEKSFSNEMEYQKERQEGEASDIPHLIPPALLWTTLFFNILGTFMWLVLATDARIILPMIRWMGYDKLSIGHVLFLCVLLEDMPQVVLTFLIEDYYEVSKLSNVAVVNVIVSLYDSMIKLAEAYDERHDIVETGQWCKESFWAHHDVITAIVSISPFLKISVADERRKDPSGKGKEKNKSLPSREEQYIRSSSNFKRRRLRRSSNSILNEALEPIAPTKLPRLKFLTASLDKTIRLWDTAATIKGHRREKCIRVIRGHSEGVTSLVLLGKRRTVEVPETSTCETSTCDDDDDDEKEDSYNTFFVTGCQDGELKMWNFNGECIRTYPAPTMKVGVTDITVVKPMSYFACGYQDGSVRLYDAWSTFCIGVYKGHSHVIQCICSMKDNQTFVTGSKDNTLKLWDTRAAIEDHSQKLSAQQRDRTMHSLSLSLFSSTAIHEEFVCQKTLSIATSDVVCAVCLEPARTLVAGYSDGVARLWELKNGACMKSFEGHYGTVTSIEKVDDITILTGSEDRSVKVWDVISGVCLRSYVNHTDFVSSISIADDGHTFLTASGDRTVKMWVLSSLPGPERDGLIRCSEEQQQH